MARTLPVPPSAELALTGQYPPTKFSTLKDLKKIVARLRQFESILEAHRRDLGGVKLTYFGDIETLIIKLVSEAHERAHITTLGQRIFYTVRTMQVGFEEFTGIGSTRYRGQRAPGRQKKATRVGRTCVLS
ncbi:hypothetical protein Egran_05537 [Elaphomyces granulatus]|uniref:Uncharacterized protein n=1 Tax=Elaphomyces granulatus TaxID=519963 RepID=A0A232LSA9_9EURO|nr:hypothetical protein Egran_05537 [Elaphomyces granulatus]